MFRLTLLLCVVSMTACLPGPISQPGNRNITVYAFSIMKEALERDIYPSFAAKWKREHGEEVTFSSSFAGSETITNQIIQGAPADIAILSIEMDVNRMVAAGHVKEDWRAAPQLGIVNKTAFVILVRPGNPHGIRDYRDLAKPGIKLIHPDPVSSGGAQWSILSIYGAELIRSELETGEADSEKVVETLRGIWANVISTPGSAREARTQFETGYGDALITYELEGILMKQAGTPVEMILPPATIMSEHPAVVIDRGLTPSKREVAYAFRNYLWSEEAQKAFVRSNFRSVTSEVLNNTNPELAEIERPFDIRYFGGWEKAHHDVIEGIFSGRVKGSR